MTPSVVLRASRLRACAVVTLLGAVPGLAAAQVPDARTGASAGTPAAMPARPAAPRLRVTGVVYDSLLGAPLAGTVVTRDGAPGVAVTDSAGRFALDSVEAAPGTFTFSHPALDSAGLPDLVAPHDFSAERGMAEVRLATPSPATVWARMCAGVPPGAGASARPEVARPGILAGVVRDARTGLPVPGGGATVAWTEVTTTPKGGPLGAPRTRALRADSAGAFRLCGVPTGVELEVQGAAERATSGWAVVRVGPRGLATVDLLVPDSAGATVTATGVVRDSTGAPRAGARVTVDGIAGIEAVTDARGAFRLAGVPVGTRTFVVRAVGYAPVAASAGLRAESPAPVEITLRRVTRLARVVVRGRAAGALADIARRRRLGGGSLLDSTVFARAPFMRTALTQVPFTTLRQYLPGVWGLANTSGCPLAVAVDERVTDWEEVNALPTDYVLALEVYRRAADVPGRFQALLSQSGRWVGRGGCGIALVWTRAAR